MAILVTHAFSGDSPERFETNSFAFDRGILLVFADPSGHKVIRAFNSDAWAAVELVED